MQVRAVIHEKYKDTEIHVCKDKMDGQVETLVRELDSYLNHGLTGITENGDKIMLTTKDVCRFYAADAKVYAQTEEALFKVPMKLYEIEKELDMAQFLRISKSEIINLKKIRRLDMSIIGTIRVYLSGDIDTYTSRRNVGRLKEALGI